MTLLTTNCPLGHRLRGKESLAGQWVRCPRCQTKFEFLSQKRETQPPPETKSVTDTGVMRILDACPPQPVRKRKPDQTPIEPEVVLKYVPNKVDQAIQAIQAKFS